MDIREKIKAAEDELTRAGMDRASAMDDVARRHRTIFVRSKAVRLGDLREASARFKAAKARLKFLKDKLLHGDV